jgi:hypothetical protein
MSFAAETCQTIDAITKSTLSLLATSQVCETAATLNWKYNKTNGSRTLSYGKTDSYGTSGGNVTSGSPTKLTGLTPNTTYYFKVDNIYQGTNRYTLSGTFKTSTGASVVTAPTITSPTAVTCTTGTIKTYTATATDPANKTVTFSYSKSPSGALPAWITSSGAALTLKPENSSQNTAVRIIASNGTAADTQDLAITVVAATGVRNRTISCKQRTVNIGNTPVYIPFINEKTITVSLFSLDGSLAMKQVVSVQNANRNASVSLSPGINGTYMCKITSQSGEFSQKIVLQK